ncbi:hypothetical protein NMY22_g19801 [Coprinellus aureogranulatus]|nr:hypothetical protein NMY22_g19801 [Coprinellus aureogranulatus]
MDGSMVDQQQQAVYQMQQQQGQLRSDQPGYQQQYGTIATPNTATPNTATPNGLHGYAANGTPYNYQQQQYQHNVQNYGHDERYNGGTASANGHAVGRGYDDDDYDHHEYEDGTPIRPSAKALGKRKVIEPDPTDSPHTSDPDELTNHINPSLDAIDNLSDMDAESLLELTNRADNDNEGLLEDADVGAGGGVKGRHAMWPGQKPVQYVYDAAAERTKQRLEEAQRMLEQGMKFERCCSLVGVG